MVYRKKTPPEPTATSRRPRRTARTTSEQEDQMVNLAMDLVEKKLREGTATSQETTFYLKLGSTREKLEQAKLQNEITLNDAKIELMRSQRRIEELYADALKAMKSYQGNPEDAHDD